MKILELKNTRIEIKDYKWTYSQQERNKFITMFYIV